VLLGDKLLRIGGGGNFTASNEGYDRAALFFEASQDWAVGATGASMTFFTTLNGTITRLPRMTINHNGRIGVGTLSPNSLFHIHEPATSTAVNFQMSNADAGSTVSDGFKISLNQGGFLGLGVNIRNQEASFMTLGTNTFTEQIVLEPLNGGVGIGTALAQDAKLTVEANSTCCSGSPYSTLTLKETEADGARLRFTNTNSTATDKFWDVFGFSAGSGADQNATMSFYYGGTGSNVMALKGNGLVGIGTTSPADQLHISALPVSGASSYARISATSGLAGLRLQNNTGDWSIYASEFSKMFFSYSPDNFSTNTNVLTLEPNSTNFSFNPAANDKVFLGSSTLRFKEIWSVNPLNTSSDRRLKKDIKTLTYGLETVLKLNAVSYHWKNNTDQKLHLGFIAQEVDQIIPEIVSKSSLSDEDFEKQAKKGELPTDTYGMEYSSLIPVLVKAIQEQQAIIDQKTSAISSLEQRLTVLESRLETEQNQKTKAEKK
jgi:hypothetical protein